VVLGRPFQCLTRVLETDDFAAVVRSEIRGRPYAVITSTGWIWRKLLDRLHDKNIIVVEAGPNPDEVSVRKLAAMLPRLGVFLAVGGGSVIDAAKSVVALQALEARDDLFNDHLRNGTALPTELKFAELIAVPTTSGTGSEVTAWATIWGKDKRKYSVQDNRLFPAAAVLDPSLCISMSSAVTLASGLDAFSHALEAVWNRRFSTISDTLATTAITILREFLGTALREPLNIAVRRRVQTAALISGLAMSRTQTALAHSISYPFTAHLNMPHGLACSFSLPEVARFNMEVNEARLIPIAQGLQCRVREIPDHLYAWFDELGVGAAIGRYLAAGRYDEFCDELVSPSRAANNLRGVDLRDARSIVDVAIGRLSAAATQSIK
jgi:alcohol dehydrogenase class IV